MKCSCDLWFSCWIWFAADVISCSRHHRRCGWKACYSPIDSRRQTLLLSIPFNHATLNIINITSDLFSISCWQCSLRVDTTTITRIKGFKMKVIDFCAVYHSTSSSPVCILSWCWLIVEKNILKTSKIPHYNLTDIKGNLILMTLLKI